MKYFPGVFTNNSLWGYREKEKKCLNKVAALANKEGRESKFLLDQLEDKFFCWWSSKESKNCPSDVWNVFSLAFYFPCDKPANVAKLLTCTTGIKYWF